MAKDKEKFTPTEKEILSILASAGKPLTTYYIAGIADITRLTARKYLFKLMEENWVIGRQYTGTKYKKASYWWLKTDGEKNE